MAEVQMPQLGETVTEGTITKWFKQIGDRVEVDEVLFEVSTDKVDSEVPSPVSGFLSEIRVPEGETVEVGGVIAVLSDDAPAGGDAPAPAPAAPEPAPEPAPAAEPEPEAKAEPQPSAPDKPSAPPTQASAPAPAAAAASGNGKGLVSPVVRRMASEAGVDPDTITGTGIGGRITRADVEKAIKAGPSASVLQAQTVDTGSIAAPEVRRPIAKPAARSGTGDTVEPLTNIRRRTGDHMKMSKDVSPHAYSIAEIDYENVERVRRVHRESWKSSEGFSLTCLPFIARAVIDALYDFPHMNASVGGPGELIVHNYVNLSVAVDLDFQGLLAPVLHNADDKRLRAIARDTNDLANRARTKKLSADDITGGTFTITNNGSFGTHLVLPIINQPQVAILSTDAVQRRPVVVIDQAGSEAIAIHSVGLLGLAWDHRAFDGSYAGAFLSLVKEIIETRDWEAEL